jgi:hypothetical protein
MQSNNALTNGVTAFADEKNRLVHLNFHLEVHSLKSQLLSPSQLHEHRSDPKTWKPSSYGKMACRTSHGYTQHDIC